MAILELHPHIEVRVFVEGRPATEYVNNCFEHTPPPTIKDEHRISAENTVIKYIESISDATFAVQFTVFPGCQRTRPCLVLLVEVDGHFVNGMTFSNVDGLPACRRIEGWTKGSPGGSCVLLRFKFANLTTTKAGGTDRVKAGETLARELGTIDVRVYRGIRHNRVWVPVNTVPPSSISAPSAEMVVKGRALSHSTSCEDPVPCSAQIADKFHYYDDLEHPMARYVFRYRSREALRQILVIPRADAPERYLVSGLRHLHFNRETQRGRHTQHPDQAAVIDFTSDEEVGLQALKRKAKQEWYRPQIDQASVVDLTEDDEVNLEEITQEVVSVDEEWWSILD